MPPQHSFDGIFVYFLSQVSSCRGVPRRELVISTRKLLSLLS